MNSLASRVALIAAIGMMATIAPAAAAMSGNDSSAKETNVQLAQGATPEGWRKEGEPRFKAKKGKVAPMTDGKASEPTYFRPEGEPRFKKPSTKN